MPTADPFNLSRFVAAQASVYPAVLLELRAGRKTSHWMWYVFPQIRGLGQSLTSRRYAIGSRAEAEAYLRHPLLGARLEECASILLALDGPDASGIFGYPDDLKLHSSMSLFARVAGRESLFGKVLDKYFQGKLDQRTQDILRAMDA